MTTLQAVLLGLFQGIAEFLPISSSGHLLILKDLLGLQGVPALFDVVLHMATLLSILVVFRVRVYGILRSMARWLVKKSDEGDKENLAIVLPALLATALTALIGLGVESRDIAWSPAFASGMLLVSAAILIASSFLRGNAGYDKLGLKHGLITGVAQGIGVLPGISRSGITISAGLASGMKRETAGEFAFLLAIPAILGALVLELKDIGRLLGSVEPVQLIAGSAAAFLAGIAALLLLLPVVRKGKLAWFAVYLIPAGILGLILL
ncbi:MAG TPA: undecaprenyl-diphosphatase [Spirochaetaceae bacterium]|nr:undecaprenyl-diphosphatase [Spirochaetaceae bacterium]